MIVFDDIVSLESLLLDGRGDSTAQLVLQSLIGGRLIVGGQFFRQAQTIKVRLDRIAMHVVVQ